MNLAKRLAVMGAVAVAGVLAFAGSQSASGTVPTHFDSGQITVTTDSNGFTPLLGYGQTYGGLAFTNPNAIIVETESPISGVSALPYQTAVQILDSGCHWKVRFFDQTGVRYASTSVTFRYAAFDGTGAPPIC